jgi:hypothetical protein
MPINEVKYNNLHNSYIIEMTQQQTNRIANNLTESGFKVIKRNTYNKNKMTPKKQPNGDDFNSLCIPRMDDEISKWEISNVIRALNLGTIQRIDEVINHKFGVKRVFIHMKKWNENETVQEFKEKMKSNGHVNIVYNFPNFWKCYINTAKKI